MITGAEGELIEMAREFTLVPRAVEHIHTPLRRIVTDLPAPESIPLLEKLYEFEPRAVFGKGFQSACESLSSEARP